MRLSLKLGALCAAAAFLPTFIILLVVGSKVSSDARERSLEQLRRDSRGAYSLFEKRVVELRASAQMLALEIATRALVSADTPDRNSPAALARLQDMLPRAQNDASLDLVMVTDPLGRVIARHNDRPVPGETLLGLEDKNPVAEKVITGGNQPVASCVIERGERYGRLGLDRIAPVRLPDGTTTDEALMIEAGAPIFSGGRIVGVALIGQMLNTYYKPRAGATSLLTPLVAEARQTLYGGGEEDAGAVIALGKVIVASSIPPVDTAAPALSGLLHDPSKAEEEFRRGARSYIVAWQPLKLLDGTAVGAIGVARPASEFEGVAGPVRSTILLVAVIATLLAAGAGFWFGLVLGARLDDLTEAARRWGLGELSAPAGDRTLLARWVPDRHLRDEINRLAGQLEEMRESFRQAIERMKKR
ncbi:MAG TPA: hypothetical protein VLM38_18385 [Blastocatellia bacterium]|nr:hypothetical protein [Blastocatellia bacterium]